MARNRGKQPETPEQVIASRRRRAADREMVKSFFSRLLAMGLLL